jgi:hypothetical protein
MLDRSGAESPGRATAARSPGPNRGRRRALVACAVLVLLLHAAFIGSVGGLVPGSVETSLAPMSLRTLPDAAPFEAPVEATPEAMAEASMTVAPAVAPLPPTTRTTRLSRQLREPTVIASQPAVNAQEKASANSDAPSRAAETALAGDGSPRPAIDAPIAATDAGEAPPPTGTAATAARPPLLAAGDEPPPLYRTQLPPSLTLHYQVQRGALRGSGQIRWSPAGDHYRLAFVAQVAGLTVLMQTSEGDIGAHGLVPVRFLDQRARRSAQAANFRRDDGRITFSGTRVEWPLLAGSQDRLSWMIQLAGIAAAEPERLVDGGAITMVVVGARGDAGVWTFRYAGRETIEAVRGTVQAVKFVRAGRSAYDTSAEIWLDPERSYLPARATLRNSTGASEYDLLLERVDSD